MRRAALIALVAVAALAAPAAAWAHAALLRTVPQASGTVNTPPKQLLLTYSEPVEPRFAIVSVTDAAGRQQTAGPPHRSPTDPDTLVVPLKRTRGGLVPRLLAGDLGRRPSRPGCVHVRRRPERGAGAGVRDPFGLRDGGDAEAHRLPLADVPVRDGVDRPARAAARDRPPRRAARRRHRPASRVDRVPRRLGAGADRHTRVRPARDLGVRAALVLLARRAAAARARLRVRTGLHRPRDLLRALRRGGRDRDRCRPPRARAPLRRGAARIHRRAGSPPPRPCSCPARRAIRG